MQPEQHNEQPIKNTSEKRHKNKYTSPVDVLSRRC